MQIIWLLIFKKDKRPQKGFRKGKSEKDEWPGLR